MDERVYNMLVSIEERLTRIEQRLFEPMNEIQPLIAPLSIMRKAELPDDREMERRMREAAAGKELVNGIMRRPDGSRAP